ncbi:hypothetical protein V6N11_024632 [Hibiscus sabdariffa]|uniref:Uncharacterized protein n=1 Tax=Hibiscus sabdariffa TaxID=183260 RepID=A0ABR2QMP8_9ROSI
MKEVIVDKNLGDTYGGNSRVDNGLADTVAKSIEKSGEVIQHVSVEVVMSQEANLQQVPEQLSCFVDIHDDHIHIVGFEETGSNQMVVGVQAHDPGGFQ